MAGIVFTGWFHHELKDFASYLRVIDASRVALQSAHDRQVFTITTKWGFEYTPTNEGINRHILLVFRGNERLWVETPGN